MPDDRPELAVADVLTPLAKSILLAGGDRAYSQLVVHGPGSDEARRLLKGIRPAELVARPVADDQAAVALLAGLWLWLLAGERAALPAGPLRLLLAHDAVVMLLQALALVGRTT